MKQIAITAVLAMAFATAGAHAGLINAGDQLAVSGTILPGSLTGYVSYGGGTAINCYAGAFSLNVNDTTTHNTFTIQTFCTDVGVEWKNSDTYTAKNFSGQTGISPAWSGQAAIQDVAYLYNTYFSTSLSVTEDAGLQLAIWKVLYDSGSDGTISSQVSGFDSGKLQASGFGTEAMLDAANYVSDINAARAGGSFPTYTGLWLSPNDGNSQGLIWTPGTPNGNGGPVPEPSTFFAAALLLVPLGVGISRITRKSRGSSLV